MSARKRLAVVIAFFAAGLTLSLLGGLRNPEMGKWAGLPLILIGGALEPALFRCPACGRWVRKGFWPGKHCPHCGDIIE